jgi:Calcineurin-like phosphoesterase
MLGAPGAARADTGILAVGDFGVGGQTERRMGAGMRRYAANHLTHALVTLGDNDYTESPSAFHRNWTESFGWAARRGLRISGTLGNHDVEHDGGRYEFDELNMPRRYYSRRVGNVALFLLNSNRVTRTQTAWLRRALRRSRARWKVAAFHHPPFTCGGHSGAEDVRARWNPLFRRFGVDLVLSGHDHNYQRFARRGGVTYVVHGGGGAGLYNLHHCPASYPRMVEGREVHGFLYLRASDRSLLVRAVRRGGRSVDTFRIYP